MKRKTKVKPNPTFNLADVPLQGLFFDLSLITAAGRQAPPHLLRQGERPPQRQQQQLGRTCLLLSRLQSSA